MRKKLLKIALFVLLGICVLSLLGIGWAYRQLSASLPQLDGEFSVDTIQDSVTIERDARGIVNIVGQNRQDVAYALGFAHGQDRFFQMDLLRRNAAGELSEIVGPAVIERDKQTRVHQFRVAAEARFNLESLEVRAMLEAYSAGVNAGLKSLSNKPFEYLLLGVDPQPWQPEDCLLTIYSMYLDLQGDQFRREVDRGLLHDHVPPPLYDFLMAKGDQWDAPMEGSALQVPPVPGPDLFDARTIDVDSLDKMAVISSVSDDTYIFGSNNWAVSGRFTKDGRALVADDMHLRIQVPNIWYRASLNYRNADEPDGFRRVTGVTLPGSPAIVVGSNRHVAWGFTNTEGDWLDVIQLETSAEDPLQYLTPEGFKSIQTIVEKIAVKDGEDIELPVQVTQWGPVLGHDYSGAPLVARWVAYDLEGINVNLIGMEAAMNIEQAVEQANTCGVPHQNFVVGDTAGNIAWTVMGAIPRREGFDGQLPGSWSDGNRQWNGFLTANEYPRIINPSVGKLWSANARVVSDHNYQLLGDSGYDRGARQQQIRDQLLPLETADESTMLAIQMDDRAVFLQRWQQLLLSVLSPEALDADSRRKPLRSFVEEWGGAASADSVGFRVVQSFRRQVESRIQSLVSQPLKQIDPVFSLARNRRFEGPLWKLIDQRPLNFLDPRFETWDQFLLSCVDAVIEDATAYDKRIEHFTWGQINTTKIQHPLSRAIPLLSGWLDMQSQAVDGAWSDMPHIQAPQAGASQRMAVSPGREEDGFMQIPCGQSGHPLSPYYRNLHQDWVEGNPTPFLPGPAEHTLRLIPQK